MGVKFGEIDSGQILDNEFRIGVLENVLDLLLRKNPNLIGFTAQELENIREQVANTLKKKYPNSGIEYKKPV
jgi:hypothetical protein